MREILILGASPKTRRQERMYGYLADICRKYADKVNSPLNTAGFAGSVEEKYKRALLNVRRADLIVVELSRTSTGAGFELGYAATLRTPIIVLAGRRSSISDLVLGCPEVKATIDYEHFRDLKLKLPKVLEEMKQ